ncbi:MAG: hypothetical protein ACO3JL_14665 [Myxococcota bacterium]
MHQPRALLLLATVSLLASSPGLSTEGTSSSRATSSSAFAAGEQSARSTSDDPLGLGPVLSRVEKGTTAYLALARGGVAVVDESSPGAPVLLGTLLPGQAISRLLLEGDRLWVIVLSESATSFSLSDPLAPVLALPLGGAAATSSLVVAKAAATTPAEKTITTSTPGSATSISTTAKVLSVRSGRVLFDAGSDQGFAPGMRVKVISQRLVKKPDLKSGGVVEVPSGEVTAVVTLEEVEPERAMALLGRGDQAQTGDLVQATDEPLSEKLFLPRRAPFHWRAGFVTRPFLGVGVTGSYPVGALSDAYVHYTFDALPVTVSAEVAPLGFALFAQDAHYPGTFVLSAAYVTDFFEVGLGGGALIGNLGPCEQPLNQQEFDDDGDGSPDRFEATPVGGPVCEENNGATFNQRLRLGALDGLHLSWASSIFARPNGFTLGVGRGELSVPVSSRLGLFGGGGGGEKGWA